MSVIVSSAGKSESTMICLCCMSRDHQMKNLMLDNRHKSFERHSGLQIQSSKESLFLCKDCNKLLDDCIRFENKCKKAHEKLLHMGLSTEKCINDQYICYNDQEMCKVDKGVCNDDQEISNDGRELCNDDQILCNIEQITCNDNQDVCIDDQEICHNDQDLSNNDQIICNVVKITCNDNQDVFHDDQGICNVDQSICSNDQVLCNKNQEMCKNSLEMRNDVQVRHNFDQDMYDDNRDPCCYDRNVNNDESICNGDQVICSDDQEVCKDDQVICNDDVSFEKQSKTLITVHYGQGSKGMKIKNESKRKDAEVMENIDVLTFTLEQQRTEMCERKTSRRYLNSLYKCEMCVRGFSHENSYFEHLKMHLKSRGEFECKLCGQFFNLYRYLQAHSLVHARRYRCRLCGRHSGGLREARQHCMQVHFSQEAQYTCEECGHKTRSRISHYRHVKLKHSREGLTSCSICQATFTSKQSYRDHMIRHSGVKPFTCEDCEKRFSTFANLATHRLVHSNTRDFYCVQCDKTFKCRTFLNQHLRVSPAHRDANRPVRFPCRACTAICVSRSELTKHKVSSHGYVKRLPENVPKQKREKTKCHQCEECGKAFALRSTLVNHQRTHSGQRPFSCSVCSQRFSQRASLFTHNKTVHQKLKRKPSLVCEK